MDIGYPKREIHKQNRRLDENNDGHGVDQDCNTTAGATEARTQNRSCAHTPRREKPRRQGQSTELNLQKAKSAKNILGDCCLDHCQAAWKAIIVTETSMARQSVIVITRRYDCVLKNTMLYEMLASHEKL